VISVKIDTNIHMRNHTSVFAKIVSSNENEEKKILFGLETLITRKILS